VGTSARDAPSVLIAAPEDGERLAMGISWPRKHEIAESASVPAGVAIRQAIRASKPSAYILEDAEGPLAAFGVIPVPSIATPLGVPWIYLTDRARGPSVARELLRWLPHVAAPYGALACFVDEANEKAIDFAYFLGFTLLRVRHHKLEMLWKKPHG
jgi:GNAT superfamily N-acetyltransferase